MQRPYMERTRPTAVRLEVRSAMCAGREGTYDIEGREEKKRGDEQRADPAAIHRGLTIAASRPNVHAGLV